MRVDWFLSAKLHLRKPRDVRHYSQDFLDNADSRLIAVKTRKYLLHKKLMTTALILSVIFLISYIIHHLLAGDTKFGGSGVIKIVYLIILFTHIFLAAVILPFILFTAYRALIAEYDAHKKLARITWPLWLYISVTGPIIYLLISPYYQ